MDGAHMMSLRSPSSFPTEKLNIDLSETKLQITNNPRVNNRFTLLTGNEQVYIYLFKWKCDLGKC